MSTIAVTCPEDNHTFVVVEPSNRNKDAFAVDCPNCGEQFTVVYPSQDSESSTSEIQTPQGMTLEETREHYGPARGIVHDWTLLNADEVADPYTGSDKSVPVTQLVVAKVRYMGGPRDKKHAKKHGISHPSDLPESFEGESDDTLKIWYTPEHAGDPDDIGYVIRSDLETGIKTKNVYRDGDELFVKNRGVPYDSDKQWTFLDEEECQARAGEAGLPEKIVKDPSTDKPNRYRIYLNEDFRPLVNNDDELEEELVLELARVLTAFQTYRIIW